jgi:hypothetical protein
VEKLAKFDTLSKFTADMEEALEEFQESLRPMSELMRELHTELRVRRSEEHSLQNKLAKRRRMLSDDDFSDPDERRNPVKTEVREGQQEAEEPDTVMIEKWQEGTSSRVPPKEQPPNPEEPHTAKEVLAEEGKEEGEL